MTKRSRGRPPLIEGEAPVKRTVLLPADLDKEAERAKGTMPWATWLRHLVEQAVEEDVEEDRSLATPPAAE